MITVYTKNYMMKKTRKEGKQKMQKKFIVETSARHVHVTKETLEVLFGKG